VYEGGMTPQWHNLHNEYQPMGTGTCIWWEIWGFQGGEN